MRAYLGEMGWDDIIRKKYSSLPAFHQQSDMGNAKFKQKNAHNESGRCVGGNLWSYVREAMQATTQQYGTADIRTQKTHDARNKMPAFTTDAKFEA